jgi:hypothetical protein
MSALDEVSRAVRRRGGARDAGVDEIRSLLNQAVALMQQLPAAGSNRLLDNAIDNVKRALYAIKEFK